MMSFPLDTYLQNLVHETETFFTNREMVFFQLMFTPRVRMKSVIGTEIAVGRLEANEQKEYVIDEAVRKFSRLIILGEPGTGKTTAIRWVALSYAKAAVARSASGRGRGIVVPLLAHLRNFTSQADGNSHQSKSHLISFLADALAAYVPNIEPMGTHIEYFLAHYNVLLMLDGLNEIPSILLRSQCVAAIHDLCRAFPHIHCIVTARKHAFELEHFKEKEIEELAFKPVEVEELSRADIEQFLGCYGLTGEEIEAFLAQLDIRLFQLAQNPMLLSILIRMFKTSRILPKGKGDLFRVFMASALEKPCHSPRTGQVEMEHSTIKALKHEICVRIAYQMQLTYLSMPVSEVANVIAGAFKEQGIELADIERIRVLNELRDNGILEPFKKGRETRWEFKHQAYQEYFAAAWIAQEWRENGISAIDQYVNNILWHEALALAAGLIETQAADENDRGSATTLISYIRSRGGIDDMILAAMCIGNLERTDRKEIAQFVESLRRSLYNNIPLFARLNPYLVGLLLVAWGVGFFLLLTLFLPLIPSLLLFSFFDLRIFPVIAYSLLIPPLIWQGERVLLEHIRKQLAEQEVLPALIALRHISFADSQARESLRGMLVSKSFLSLERFIGKRLEENPEDTLVVDDLIPYVIKEALEHSSYKDAWDEDDLLRAITRGNRESAIMARYLAYRQITEQTFDRLLSLLQSPGKSVREIAYDVIIQICVRDSHYKSKFVRFLKMRKDRALPSSKECESTIERLQMARSEMTSVPRQLFRTLAGVARTKAGKIVLAVAAFLTAVLLTVVSFRIWSEDAFRRDLMIQIIGGLWAGILASVLVYVVKNLRSRTE